MLGEDAFVRDRSFLNLQPYNNATALQRIPTRNMANTTAAHPALFNTDLLDIVMRYTERCDIASLRLCNKTLEAAATPHLFRKLVLSAQKRHMRRLVRVANTDKFAKGVRELVWETFSYEDFEYDEAATGRFTFESLPDRHMGKSWTAKQFRASMAELESLKLHEQSFWKDEKTLNQIVTALKNMSGVRKLVVTVWDGRNRRQQFHEWYISYYGTPSPKY